MILVVHSNMPNATATITDKVSDKSSRSSGVWAGSSDKLGYLFRCFIDAGEEHVLHIGVKDWAKRGYSRYDGM